MTDSALPAHLEVLLTDEPVLDLYAHGPSRFPTTLEFPDYSDDELLAIFDVMVAGAGFHLADGVADGVRDLLRAAPRGSSFGNGRFMRNLLDRTIAQQAERITSGAPDEVRLLRPEDLPRVVTEKVEELVTGQYL